MYALLLLDEGSPIRFGVLVLKAIPIAILYVVALYFLFHNARTSESTPIGVGIAGLLAFIGFRLRHSSYEGGESYDTHYFLVFFLCIPLIAAVFVYFFLRNSPRK